MLSPSAPGLKLAAGVGLVRPPLGPSCWLTLLGLAPPVPEPSIGLLRTPEGDVLIALALVGPLSKSSTSFFPPLLSFKPAALDVAHIDKAAAA